MARPKSNGVLSTPRPVEVMDGRGFGFETREVNTFARANYMDTFGFWQSRFGLYSYMRLNKLNKFTIYSPQGHPLMLQPWNSCSVTPTGSLTVGQRELEPEKAVIFEKFCFDELLDSCFQHFIEWSASGDNMMDANGSAMFNELVNEMMANAALAFRASLASGDLYNVNTVEYSADNTANLTTMFGRTHGTFQGWVKLLMDMASAEGVGHLNQGLMSESDFDETGYTGNIIELYDKLRANAKRPMRTIINQGGVMVGGRSRFTPLFVVSDLMFNAVINEYNALADQVATNRVRISRQEVNNGTGTTPTMIYFIDSTPIIPLSDISVFDAYVEANTHFAGIIGSGNIQMGTSFANIPQNIEDGIAMMFGQETDGGREDYGTYWFRSHMLGKAAIADTDYISSTILQTAG